MILKRSSTVFLRIVILLIGIGALAALVLQPQFEGRNVNADFVTIYFRDPFLLFVYAGSIPFFVALYQAFKLLGYIDLNQAFSQPAVDTLRDIKYCALALGAAIITALLIIRFTSGDDDAAGAIAIGIVVTFASIVVATAAALFQELLQNAVDYKSENDLTV